MKILLFGLTVSSSWGNGHATLWRGLCKGLAKRGHRVVFFERNVPYYANHRDLTELPGGQLILYADWSEAVAAAQSQLEDAEVGMVTSYCPDGVAATDWILSSPLAARIFYDMDTPVTLGELQQGRPVSYLGADGLRHFDLVLSYTGGAALEQLRRQLHARRVAPLYGSVDPDLHRPVPPVDKYRCDLSYLGTYAEDRQAALERLFLEPARRAPERRFLIGGAQYPASFPWSENIAFVKHRRPAEHPAFFSSSRLTLNVTRRPMADLGYCPSGRLFEAAACQTPLISDGWEGLDQFFEPGRELLIAHSSQDVLDAMELTDNELQRIAQAARQRTLEQHTADHRARELEMWLETVLSDSWSSDEAASCAR